MTIYRKISYTLLSISFLFFIYACVPVFFTHPDKVFANINYFYTWIEKSEVYEFAWEFYFSALFFIIPAYALFDLLRRWIVGKNPTIRWRLWENMVLIIIYWVYLIMQARHITPLSFHLGWVTLIGVVAGSCPVTLYNLGAKFLSAKTVRRILIGWIILFVTLTLILK